LGNFLGTEDDPYVQKPTGSVERLVIINAISSSGWVNGAKLVFQATRKTGDYHGQMNASLQKWFREKLIPNIPDNSLIIRPIMHRSIILYQFVHLQHRLVKKTVYGNGL